MHSAKHNSGLCVGILTVLLLSTLVAAENATAAPALPPRYLAAATGDYIKIYFNTLYPKAVGDFVYTITKLPESGKLTTMPENKDVAAIEPKTSPGNRFRYQTDKTFTGTVQIEFSRKSGDVVENGAVVIRVRRGRSFARAQSLRAYAGEEVVTQLSARNYRGSARINDTSMFSIVTAPRGGCTIKIPNDSGDYTIVDATLAPWKALNFSEWGLYNVGKDNKYLQGKVRVYVTPPADAQPGHSCTFYYRVFDDTNGGSDAGSNSAPVTITVAKKAAPRASRGSTMFALGGTSRFAKVGLTASTGVPGEKVTFVLKKAPTVGSLYYIVYNGTLDQYTDTMQLPAPLAVADGSPGTEIATITSRRLVLLYNIPAGKIPDGVKDDTIEWVARSAGGESAVATFHVYLKTNRAPQCGTANYGPVFGARPLRNILLNYTDPSGMGVDRLVFASSTTNTLGSLFYTVSVASDTSIEGSNKLTKELRFGDAFTDANNALSYQVKNTSYGKAGVDTLRFRAYNKAGESCGGVLTVRVAPADAPPASSAPGQPVVPVRREYVTTSTYTLIGLRGSAIDKIVDQNIGTIKKLPTMGQIFAVAETAPPPSNGSLVARLMRNNGRYCRMNDCANPAILGKPLQVGDVVHRMWEGQLMPKVAKMFIIYKAPEFVPAVASPSKNGGSFSLFGSKFSETRPQTDMEFTVTDVAGAESAVQRIVYYISQGQLPSITIRYRKQFEYGVPGDILGLGGVQLRGIRVDVLNETARPGKAVCVMPVDLIAHHGAYGKYYLYNYEEQGDRIKPTTQLAKSALYGQQGYWLPNGTISIVKAANTTQQVFRFNVRIYTLDGNQQIPSLDSGFEQREVVVIRENIPPMMVKQNTSEPYASGEVMKIQVSTDRHTPITLFADDMDGDPLSFRLLSMPKQGVLSEVMMMFNLGFPSKPLHAGSKIKLPIGQSAPPVVLKLDYRAPYLPNQKYPMKDSFQIVADDGSLTTSAPLKVEITIIKNQRSNRHSQAFSMRVVTISGGAIVGLLISGLVAWAFYKRRQARRKYMQLPKVRAAPTEMHAVAVSTQETAAPKPPTAADDE